VETIEHCPACEKVRSPNLVRSRGVTYLLLEADRRPVRVAALLNVQTMSLRYARHLSASVYSVHRAQFKVNTTADRQPVQHHQVWRDRDMVVNVQLMD